MQYGNFIIWIYFDRWRYRHLFALVSKNKYVGWAIAMEASPEIMQLLEEALKMPKKPNWDLRPDLALQQ